MNVGTDHDTAAFAVASSCGWWQTMGREAYRDAHELLITADGGGSNGSRCRLWTVELQKFADETGLSIAVSPSRQAPRSGTRLSIICSSVSPGTGVAGRSPATR